MGHRHRSPFASPAHHRAGAPVLDLRYRSVGAFLVAYSTRLSRGELFVETPQPLPVGARATVRLRPPGARPLELEGNVVWVRPIAIGPGQPAGMGMSLATSIEEHGAVIDELAFRHARLRMLVAGADAGPRTVVVRYLRSILSCDIVTADLDPDHSTLPEEIDLAVIDLDERRELGERVIEALRQRPATADVPIIALAQWERDRARAAELEVDEVLATPPLFSELRSAVLYVLSRPLPVSARPTDGPVPLF